MLISKIQMEDNLKLLQKQIEESCTSCSRSSSEITLFWVSKFHPIELVEQAYALGARDFGENRVQEAIEKFTTKQEGMRLHVIGPVQSNKLKKAVQVADSIHSVHSLKTLERLNLFAKEASKVLDVFIQVNTSEEDTKSGVSMDSIHEFLNEMPELENLNYKGLMTIGKNTGNPEDSRKGFAFLRKLRDEFYNSKTHFKNFSDLSMGMTDDLKVAIEEGSTILRVGTALFGNRN